MNEPIVQSCAAPQTLYKKFSMSSRPRGVWTTSG